MRAAHLRWIAGIGLVLAGCSQPPTIDIDAANHALDDARQHQADVYASQSWTAAQDAEEKLAIELDAQAKRWPALRSYAVASQLALDAKQAAERSRDEAIAGRERAKTEAATMMSQAREEHERAHAALNTAPRGKGTQADLASLKSDASGIDETLQDMQRAFDAGDYLGAKTKAQAAIDAAKKVQSEVEEAKNRRGAA